MFPPSEPVERYFCPPCLQCLSRGRSLWPMKNRTILKYHSLLGLILGIFLLIMGITGAILVFQHDLDKLSWKDHLLQPDARDLGIKTVQEKYSNWDTRLMHFKEKEALIFNLRKPTQRLFLFVHPSTGAIIKEVNELTTFTRWLLRFHYSFQGGIPGRFLVFFIGILFLLSLVTGTYLYRKSFLKTFKLKLRFRGKNKRTFYSSLHRLVGVWALLLNLVLVLTGIFLSYKVATSALADPVVATTPQVQTSINGLLRVIQRNYPDFTPTYIRLPGNPNGEIRVFGQYHDDPFFYSEFYNSFHASYHTGNISRIVKVQQADLSTKLASTLIPLHFGQFGGIFSKLLYFLIGFSGPVLSVSGYFLWLKRKKNFTA